ncbi:MAG: hypothetical protein KBD50_03425, partial [Candidatus Pacebacteria bacterium]|nr:hypothetical protein [Candidatus Paceibacterota bacterium]
GGGAIVATDTPTDMETMDWKGSLTAILGENTAAKPIDAATLDSLQAETKTDTLTGTVARSLLLNLAEAKSQGLGSDFPTQERLVAQATTQSAITRGEPTYDGSDVTVIPETEESVKAYGNALAAILQKYPKTSREETVYVVAEGLQKGSKSLAPLTAIEGEYRSMTTELIRTPVPLTLQPLHLQIINNLARIVLLYPDIKVMFTDPLRAIGALELHQTLVLETQRLLTSVARILDEGGILFTSDEPGAVWSLLLTFEGDL